MVMVGWFSKQYILRRDRPDRAIAASGDPFPGVVLSYRQHTEFKEDIMNYKKKLSILFVLAFFIVSFLGMAEVNNDANVRRIS
jgi:hypothetical protein